MHAAYVLNKTASRNAIRRLQKRIETPPNPLTFRVELSTMNVRGQISSAIEQAVPGLSFFPVFMGLLMSERVYGTTSDMKKKHLPWFTELELNYS